MSWKVRENPEDRALGEAIAWRVRLFENDLESNPEFENWLGADPTHKLAWTQSRTSWDAISEIAVAPELVAMRHEALSYAAGLGRRSRCRRVSRALVAGVAAALLFVAAGTAVVWRLTAPTAYETAFGERRVIALADGSVASLDSNTKLLVRYSTGARSLELVRGQARFEVAHNAKRPFRVTAGAETVIATGTSFNVDMLGASVFVTLLEGRVAVLDRPAAMESARGNRKRSRQSKLPEPTWLKPGEQLIARAGAAPGIQTIAPGRATAWQDGVLVFDNDRLSTIAERVSRYSSRPVIVRPEVADLRLSGVFKIGDVDGFVEAMTAYLPVWAETGEKAIVLRSRS
jgi:transmembrane sensor